MKRVLEIGVGGNKRYKLNIKIPFHPAYEYYFCDIEPGRVHGIVIEYCNVEERLPYPDGFFDEVYFSHVIEHLRDPEKALREIYRVLKKDGVLHVWTPNWLSKNCKLDPDHKVCFSFYSLYKLLRKTGFEVRIPYVMSNWFNRLPSFVIKILVLIHYNFSDELYLVGVKR